MSNYTFLEENSMTQNVVLVGLFCHEKIVTKIKERKSKLIITDRG
jgi:hypothetical protein